MSTYELETPLKKSDVLKLKVGDVAYLSGTIFSMRDQAHLRALREGAPVDLNGGAIYHCGPIVEGKRVVSAGPTTSARMNKMTPEMIKKFGISIVIGKGGMDGTVLESMAGSCAYLSFTGGCGLLAAGALEVKGAFWPELGEAEALWVFGARRFGPLVVSMDSHGNSIYRDVAAVAEKTFERL